MPVDNKYIDLRVDKGLSNDDDMDYSGDMGSYTLQNYEFMIK